MSNLSQKFKIVVELDLQHDGFDVHVENLSIRKGFIDIEQLKTKLMEVMHFMLDEGVDSLVEHVNAEQIH